MIARGAFSAATRAGRYSQGVTRGLSGPASAAKARVTEVVRDYGRDERAQAPEDSREAHGV